MKTYQGWKASKELVAFKKDFEKKTGISVSITENPQYFHWKRLIFQKLNCHDLKIISNYIEKTFSENGKYTHLLPTIHVWDGHLALTVDVSEIKKFILE